MLQLQPLGAARQTLRIRPLGDAPPATPSLSGDDRPPADDAATGRLRGGDVPADIRPLILSNTAPYAAGSGPFEGTWVARDSSGRSFTLWLYDRREWVVGLVSTGARANFIGRRSGDTVRGRIERGSDRAPYQLTVTGNTLRSGSYRGYSFTATRTAGPPAPRREERSGRSGSGGSRGVDATPKRPWFLYGLIGLGAVAVLGGVLMAGKR